MVQQRPRVVICANTCPVPLLPRIPCVSRFSDSIRQTIPTGTMAALRPMQRPKIVKKRVKKFIRHQSLR
ncbi:hypothetical protein DPEC_G00193110 [Dallia pectoralis]|uniref:Uncharacterized protein n=1 Tax=Dallia pectoralis TaxID=75939 RepID=A0ACC2G713_DALPE|nr:hypothetical protein DPEC_G00193110 [Dallia pectoralis]